jgi:hypothetical protein
MTSSRRSRRRQTIAPTIDHGQSPAPEIGDDDKEDHAKI